jgi:hypothetical protein
MLRFVFFIVLSCFISSKEAQACSCARVPMPGTAQDAYFEKQAQQADYIFLATVTDQRAGSEKSKEFWDFKVEKVWKGNVQPVFTYESSQEMCSFGIFKKEETYLVYATIHQKDDTSNVYDISSCSYTRLASKAQDALVRLDAESAEK